MLNYSLMPKTWLTERHCRKEITLSIIPNGLFYSTQRYGMACLCYLAFESHWVHYPFVERKLGQSAKHLFLCSREEKNTVYTSMSDDRIYSFGVVSRQEKTEEDTQEKAEHQREAYEKVSAE